MHCGHRHRSSQRPDSISRPHQKSELDNRGRQAPHVDESITEPTVTVDATKGGDDISLRHRQDVAKRKRLLHGEHTGQRGLARLYASSHLGVSSTNSFGSVEDAAFGVPSLSQSDANPKVAAESRRTRDDRIVLSWPGPSCHLIGFIGVW